jgi:CRISPR-associated protein Csd2
METIKNRYEFVLLFDVQDGNPNGDPDAGNLPRVDAETGMGLVTDVCLKRKVRNYVQMVHGCQKPNDIFIKSRTETDLVLNDRIAKARKETKSQFENSDTNEGTKSGKKTRSQVTEDLKHTEAARQWMMKNYYDIRTFGAVMSTGENAGQVRGPVQMAFARSVIPVVALEHNITRLIPTSDDDKEKEQTMGRKYTISYGLYRAHGFISAHLANQTGFSTADLELFWEALLNMFDHDRSAARGLMGTRALYVFKHETALGNMPAQDIFDTVKISPANQPARAFSDFAVSVDESVLQNSGVTLIRKRG